MSGERNGLEEREDQLRTGGDVRLVGPASPEYLRLVRLTAHHDPAPDDAAAQQADSGG